MLWMVLTKKIGTHTRRKSDCSLSVWNTQTYIPTEYLQLWKASHYTVSVLCLERFKFREVSTAYFAFPCSSAPRNKHCLLPQLRKNTDSALVFRCVLLTFQHRETAAGCKMRLFKGSENMVGKSFLWPLHSGPNPRYELMISLLSNSTCSTPLIKEVGRELLTWVNGLLLSSQVYPTATRALGLGTCSGMARVGALITPFIAQVKTLLPVLMA